MLIVGITIKTVTFVTLMNFLDKKAAGGIQMASTICEFLPLGLLIFFGLLHQGDITFQSFPIEAETDKSFISALGFALLATMFAYNGWIRVENIVMIVYLLINIAFLRVMSATALAGTNTPASEVATIIFVSMGEISYYRYLNFCIWND
ncbi:Serine/threonine exchanger SteT (plasmid) [Bacillus thuringiensis]|nr:Serine/threonine exchanger SteT [Bacillus thuringiensis]